MKNEDFEDWLINPVTEYVIKYLNDSVKEASEMVADTISDGGTMTESEILQTSTMCLTLRRIAEIKLDEITDFYNKED